MTKAPPATEERFRIHAEASKDNMGHILAELTKLGLANIGYELVTDIVTFRKNGARKVREVTGLEFARAFIKENASFAAIQMVNHFKANDRTDGMAYKAIRDLVQEGELKKLGPGNYQRADVKALAPPKKAEKVLKRPALKIRRYEIMNKDVILKRIRGRARFTVTELEDHFRNIKRNPKSVSAIIAHLFRDKEIARLEAGTYAWGQKKKTAKVPVKKKRGTSVAQAPVEGTTNG